MKIRIFDDEKRQRTKFLEDIKAAGLSSETFDVGVLADQEFEYALEGMRERQADFRKLGVWKQDGTNLLDDVDVLIVDFDLFATRDAMDADQVAYQARCFTTCGIIVLMNRLAHNPFDLTAIDQFASFSDLEIGQQQLGSKVLWGTGQENFAPWYWPFLPEVGEGLREARSRCQGFLAERPDDSRNAGIPKGNLEMAPKEGTPISGRG